MEKRILNLLPNRQKQMLQHTHKIFDVFYLFFCCVSLQSHGAIHKQSHNKNWILGVQQHSPVSDNYILGTEILIKAFTSSFLKTWNLFLGLTTNPWMYWWLPIISKKCPQRYIIVTYWGVLLTSAWKSQLSHSCIWGVSEVSLWTLWKRLCARASCSYLSILHTSLRVLIWGRL